MISIIVPTYNERENIRPLVDGIRTALIGEKYEIVVVDDSSPDGTSEIVVEVAENDDAVRLVRRPRKLGLGSAFLAGMRNSIGEYLVLMDADLSHRPQDLKRLLVAAEEADIVIGSRYVRGGSVEGWSLRRRLVSRTANLVARMLLGVPVKDASSGFALFKRDVLERLDMELRPKGFKLVLEVIVKSPRAKVIEVPITFVDRVRGKSKFGRREILSFLSLCCSLRRYQKRESSR